MNMPVPRSPNAPGRWDPFQDVENIYHQMSRWMDSVFGRQPDFGDGWSPLGDLSETDEAYLVEIDVPGVRKEDITVDLSGNELSVHGETKETEREGVFRHRTRRTGQFQYRTTLPQDIDAERIDANLSDGVLTVRVPKAEAAKPRRIQVKGG